MIGRTFEFHEWAKVSPAAGWSFLSGFFTQDARVDLFGHHPSNGTLWVGENTGTGFRFATWGRVDPMDGWQFVAGDFRATGRTDVVGYHPSNGSLWLFENLGHAFRAVRWGSVSPAAGWQFVAGRFTGKLAEDVAGYHPSNGTLWVGENTGAGFRFAPWGRVDPAAGWQFVAGDFTGLTGVGRADLVGHHSSNGTLWVGKNARSRFEFQQWATLDTGSTWRLAAGFFSSRGKADVLAHRVADGTLWIGENMTAEFLLPFAQTKFEFQPWGRVAPPAGWQFVAGSFDADLWTDVVGYHAGNGTLWLGRSAAKPIEAYCWPLSAAPGESIAFMVSGEGASTATFARHWSTDESVTDVEMGRQEFDSTPQPVPPTPWALGCGWRETFRLTVPPDWPSGLYTAACVDAAGNRTPVTFVVKPDPARRAPVAVLANVNTWLAYNGWGGRSKYDGAARVSFMRPNPVAGPHASMHLTRGELWPLGWLEGQGLSPDLFTDIDFHDGIDLSSCRCLWLTTHPEYWSLGMLDRLAAYLDAGGSVVYIAGNGLFEAGEYDADRQAMTFRAGVEDGPREDALFRVLVPPRPELALLGVATERCGVAGSPFEVLRSGHLVFAGTGLADGDLFGDAGLNTGPTSFGNGKASAWEVDTHDGPGALGIPGVLDGNSCAMVDRPVPPAAPPPGLVVLARARPDGVGRGADMTWYDHPGGGFVFAAGSITFGGALVVDAAMQTMLRNVLARAGVA